MDDKFFEDNRLSIELGLMAKSVRKSKFKEAIEALRPFISENSYKYHKEEQEYWAYRMFGTDKCSCGNTKSVNQYLCAHCDSNRY